MRPFALRRTIEATNPRAVFAIPYAIAFNLALGVPNRAVIIEPNNILYHRIFPRLVNRRPGRGRLVANISKSVIAGRQ